MSKEITQAAVTMQADQSLVPAIEITDLSKSFGKSQAVDHLTLTVQRGGIFGLFEPDWLQILAAFVPLTYGRHELRPSLNS